jgi:hypothetical protein
MPFLAVEVRADDVSATVRAEITALVEAWIDAEVEGDADALESLLHEDFLSTFSSGATLDRAAYVDFILGLDIEPFKVLNERMAQFGNTVVVIDVSDDGTTKFSWIAVHDSDRWQVISQTFSPMRKADAE